MSLRTSDAARRSVRRYLIARDGRACARCGDPIERETPSIGHIIAVSLGGSDTPENLRLEHLACNQRAGAEGARAVFQHDESPPADPSAARNGARKRRMNRTTVRYG
jgi:5-methylcytosine-specific restriction endonuclease McrA